jgi:hypothetical protein
MSKRTAREIKVSDKLLTNKNINVKVGTVENRDAPETIYIFVSFWLEPKAEFKGKEQEYLKDSLNRSLNTIFNQTLKTHLETHDLFPKNKENIFIKNIPDNMNYNSKKNFISVELYLHTCNLLSGNKYPLNSKKNTEMFDEAVKISNLIGDSEVLKENSIFYISKKSS